MSLDQRGKGEEHRHKHEQERGFKIRNRRNKLFGAWVAQTHLGLAGDALAAYAKEVVMADFESPGDDDVIAKVRADLAAKDVEMGDTQVAARLAEFELEARQQVMSE